MPTRADFIELLRGERVRKSPRQGTSLSLPLAVYHRLDLLTEAAGDTDATRAEIIAMLICDAPLDADSLERAVLHYRKLTVDDVIPEAEETGAAIEDDANVVSIQKRRPGRRSQLG